MEEMQRHSLVLVVIDRILICNRNAVSTQGVGLLVSPLEAWSNVIRFTQPTCMSQFCHYVIISTLINMHVQTVCTRPSSFPILEGLGMTFQLIQAQTRSTVRARDMHHNYSIMLLVHVLISPIVCSSCMM